MKTFKNTYKSLVYLFLLAIVTSCSIDDVEPINQLPAEDAITDETSAQQVLNSVYDLGREFDLGGFPLYLAAYGNEGMITGFLSGSTGYNTNQVPVENIFLANLYNGHYKIINQSNFLIQELEAGKAIGISDERKTEMIAEAKFQRAFSHFTLLRYFGQFYDLNSSLGIVIKDQFSSELVALPRNTVQEVYNHIIEDLEYAEANGPIFIPHYFTGSLAARALLAKVSLYIGDYPRAAILADQVINNVEDYALETTYSSIFSNSFDSSEVIFAPYSGPENEGGSTMNQVNRTTYSENLRALSDAQVGVVGDGDLSGTGAGYDPRFSFAYSQVTQGNNQNGKYPFLDNVSSQGNTLYHLRLAEIFLIHAEAEARRSGGVLTDALGSLNIIRLRAGVTAKNLDPLTILEDIRQEKLLELFFENGESWFDMVRYAKLGDIDISTVKPTVISENQYVLPIPSQVRIGNNNVSQNPGY
ncbi:RagB/SusD family nutrient uptake outer membrane protein [Xanthomarina sp. F2636L]|uniref:RagB/SusD family nutrient uptake outer membrane protein n=1 Tax=Xanthomarina sp. F2636L TaxID=2996018 RepID=UPI00225E5AF6|nr:RagB/SusD family nutrient uptake outer membrane protein [Xanthomarina sp. F2636L]MCX7550060.1 RagB/SusD family nutrient uptake outer membrane protein [Xanthomarina sp. F2636L]